MPTYDMNTLQPVQTSVSYLPTWTTGADNLPEVSVTAPQKSWKFWAGLAVAGVALYILFHSGKRAARYG